MGISYASTRGGTAGVTFADAVLQGLASDGGLFVPDRLPELSGPELAGLSYAQLAHRVMQPFTDLPDADLERLCQEAYGPGYGGEVAPLRADPWGRQLELFHGPTYSFKDVALQFLGRLLDYLLAKRDQHCNLLVATSGDTGSAALHSVSGRSRLQCVVMFPRGRVSPTQELQMTTMPGANQWCLEIDGTFDQCQEILKTLNRDPERKRRLRLGAVNSVNWARLLAQSVYYVWVWLRTGEPLNVVVPTGNFGNFLSAWLAVRMGVPCRRLALATNANDIVHRFFQSGSYARGQVLETLAPAMDIQVASNLERFLYFGSSGDRRSVQEWMTRFEQDGSVTVPRLDSGGVEIASGSADETQILEAIKAYYGHTGRLICPHTAVAWHVSRQLPDLGPVTVVATAHPAKFPEAIQRALANRGPISLEHPGLADLASRPSRKVSLPAEPAAVAAWLEQNLT